MNIVVCIKQVLDTEGHIDVDRKSSLVSSPNTTISPLDVLAVEEAVRIKDRYSDVRVTVICMGSSTAEKALRSALSLGADEAVHVCDEPFASLDSYITGKVLSNTIGRESYDLILCGRTAADTQAGQVGAVIAQALGMPLVTAVVSINVEPESNALTLQRKIGGGKREVVETTMPAVLTIESGINKPRYPGLRAIKNAEKKNIETVDINALGMSTDEINAEGSLLQMTGVSAAKPSLKNLLVPDSGLSALDRINLLMSGGLGTKKAKMITDGSKEAAVMFVQFASDQNII